MPYFYIYALFTKSDKKIGNKCSKGGGKGVKGTMNNVKKKLQKWYRTASLKSG